MNRIIPPIDLNRFLGLGFEGQHMLMEQQMSFRNNLLGCYQNIRHHYDDVYSAYSGPSNFTVGFNTKNSKVEKNEKELTLCSKHLW